jgi:MOSC domain-containing protein YiiM
VTGRVHHINVSRGGVPKLPLLEATVGELGLEGDSVANPDIHGGPERAVCVYSLERIEALAAEGHPIAPGTAGENLTVAGIDWTLVRPGMRLSLGADVVLEITRFTTPCTTIRGSFRDRDSNRIHQNLHPGWSRAYARVVAGGRIRTGDPVELSGEDETFERVASPEEAREGYLLVEKRRLAFFPAMGERFELRGPGGARAAMVETRACRCRGPEKAHEHYFVRQASIEARSRWRFSRGSDGYRIELV